MNFSVFYAARDLKKDIDVQSELIQRTAKAGEMSSGDGMAAMLEINQKNSFFSIVMSAWQELNRAEDKAYSLTG